MQTMIHITVDATQETGKLSLVWRPGLLISPGCQALERFEKGIGYGYTCNFWIRTFNVEPTGFSSTEFDDMIAKVDKAGGVAIVNLFGIPRWLTSYTEDLTDATKHIQASSPPKDYDKWKEIVYSVIKHFSVDCGFKNILYEPWNEPDEEIFWLGTPEEYLKLYKYSTLAVREIEDQFGVKVRIGGPRTTSWNRWIHWFIKFCSVFTLTQTKLFRNIYPEYIRNI